MMLSTLCYIENDGAFLMLNRNRKANDVNHGKWIGVGGKFETNESPENCLIREVKEETGLDLKPGSYEWKGVLTFIYDTKPSEYIFVYKALASSRHISPGTSREGDLHWIDKEKILSLPLWEGDRIFLPLLLEDKRDFFSLKLVYDKSDRLLTSESILYPR